MIRFPSPALLNGSLWLSAVANVLAAGLFAFPASGLASAVGFPPAPPLFAGFCALFVALFGCAYGWLAVQEQKNRGLLFFGAVGKTCAVLLALSLCLAGHADSLLVLLLSGDLIFAGLWFLWLVRNR